MQFLDDSLLPENQQPLVIQVAPYGPEFLPSDSDDIPVTMAEQVRKAVAERVFELDARSTSLTCTIGISESRGQSAVELIDDAAQACTAGSVAAPPATATAGGP